jgi:hypothetical protein
MPNTIHLTKSHANSGISITWKKTSQRVSIGGWYDGRESMTLRELFDLLEITEKDCKKAFKNEPS